MDDSQPRQQQNRSRNRLTADGQTSRRPRAVAGQRAAAKRAAAQPAQRNPAGAGGAVSPAGAVAPAGPAAQVVEPIREDEIGTASDTGIDTNVESEAASSGGVEPPESSESTDADESGTSTKRATSAARTTRKTRTLRKPRTIRTGRRAIVTAVLAVALIAAAAVGAIFAVQYRDAIRTDHARTAAIAAAERAAPVIFSYDYRHLDQDFAKAEAHLTGSFRSQYAKTTQTVVKPTALQYHGVVRAIVAKPSDGSAAAVSVVSATPDQVVVLAFIDQSTTSTRVTGTQVDQNRVLLTLTHTSQRLVGQRGRRAVTHWSVGTRRPTDAPCIVQPKCVVQLSGTTTRPPDARGPTAARHPALSPTNPCDDICVTRPQHPPDVSFPAAFEHRRPCTAPVSRTLRRRRWRVASSRAGTDFPPRHAQTGESPGNHAIHPKHPRK